MCFTSGMVGLGLGLSTTAHTTVVSRPETSYVCWLHRHSLSRSDSISHCCWSKLPFCAVHHISFFVPCYVVVPRGCRSPRPRWGSSKPIFLRPNRCGLWPTLGQRGDTQGQWLEMMSSWVESWVLATLSAAPEKMNGSVTIGWFISESQFPLVCRFSAVTMSCVEFEHSRAVEQFTLCFPSVCPGTLLQAASSASWIRDISSRFSDLMKSFKTGPDKAWKRAGKLVVGWVPGIPGYCSAMFC